MVDKVIFLDIDGPMITNTDLLLDRYASFSQKLNPTCVAVLHKILENSGAKLVFNTTHNAMFYDGEYKKRKYDTPGLRQRFVDAGFEKYFHEHPRTKYPKIDRYDALNHWLYTYKTEGMLWVSLDDCNMPHKRCLTVDPNHGIGYKEYYQASKLLMFKV